MLIGFDSGNNNFVEHRKSLGFDLEKIQDVFLAYAPKIIKKMLLKLTFSIPSALRRCTKFFTGSKPIRYLYGEKIASGMGKLSRKRVKSLR